MGERKATNKYYPPEWTPEQGSLNKYHGHHPLGDRARKIRQGIIVIRFEMPWDIWCNKCNDLLPRGRRFNAEKQKVGNYMSTPIFSFKIRCNKCANWIIMQVDPENNDFLVTHGGRRRIKEVVTDETSVGLARIMSEEERQKMRSDVFSMLEHSRDELEIVMNRQPKLNKIQSVYQSRDFDAVGNNRRLRDAFRVKRKEREALEEMAHDKGLAIELLPISKEDELAARDRIEKVLSVNGSARKDQCIGRGIFKNQVINDKLLIEKIKSANSKKVGGKRDLVCMDLNENPKQIFGQVARVVFEGTRRGEDA